MPSFTAAFVSALAAVAVVASPVEKRATAPNDVQILNYALTLEHLENAFYKEALAKFDDKAFKAAGYPAWVRARFAQISQHEQSHVDLLAGALGAAGVKPCQYKFPYTDPKSFTALSAVIENVGVSAYLGAAASITDKTYLTVAGSILTTESRHQAWVGSAVTKNEGWSTPYDTPVSFSPVYSVAAQFIVPGSCPTTNAALPFTAFPALTYMDGKVAFKGLTGAGQFAVLYQGLNVATFPIAADGTVKLPVTQGTAYVLVSSEKDASKVTDDNTIAGPAVIVNHFDSKGPNPAASFVSAA